jgi:hypothetical protein
MAPVAPTALGPAVNASALPPAVEPVVECGSVEELLPCVVLAEAIEAATTRPKQAIAKITNARVSDLCTRLLSSCLLDAEL